MLIEETIQKILSEMDEKKLLADKNARDAAEEVIRRHFLEFLSFLGVTAIPFPDPPSSSLPPRPEPPAGPPWDPHRAH